MRSRGCFNKTQLVQCHRREEVYVVSTYGSVRIEEGIPCLESLVEAGRKAQVLDLLQLFEHPISQTSSKKPRNIPMCGGVRNSVHFSWSGDFLI